MSARDADAESLIEELHRGPVDLRPQAWVPLLSALHADGCSGFLLHESGAACIALDNGRITGASHGDEAGLAGLVQCIVHGDGGWQLQAEGPAVGAIERDTPAILQGVTQVLTSYGLVIDGPSREVSLLDDSGLRTTPEVGTAVLATRVYQGFLPPRVGISLGRCELVDEIGRGATSIVYRARHRGLDIDVAVKVLLPEDDAGVDHQLTANEARLLARLNHPAILRVLDFDDEDQWPYLVIEYVGGPTLAEVLTEKGRLEPSEVLPLLYQIASGLAHAHDVEGIIHCDLKPGNVLLTKDGQAKIADLGLARITNRRASAITVFDPDTSDEVRIAGTPWYIAPEQVTSGGVIADHRSDMYALGAMAYHLLSGRPLYEDPDPMQVMVRHCQGGFTSLHALVPSLDHDLVDLVHGLIEVQPDQRPDEYGELLDRLRPLAQQATDGGRSGRRTSLFKQWLSRFIDS